MTLDFTAAQAGKMHYKLYFICDSYLGADQEFDLKFRVEGPNSSSLHHFTPICLSFQLLNECFKSMEGAGKDQGMTTDFCYWAVIMDLQFQISVLYATYLLTGCLRLSFWCIVFY